MGLLASNIANVATPGFKAKDIDVQTALAAVEQTGNPASLDGALQYRVPLQPSLDGNTVDLSTEQTAFAENAVQYQTTLSFLNGRLSTITRSFRGESAITDSSLTIFQVAGRARSAQHALMTTTCSNLPHAGGTASSAGAAYTDRKRHSPHSRHY